MLLRDLRRGLHGSVRGHHSHSLLTSSQQHFNPQRVSAELRTVTLEEAIPEHTATRFWAIYDAAFRPTRVASPCRQFFREHEFHEAMSDPRILKFVRWAQGEPTSIGLVARDLEAVEWIAPEYFAARFPDHYRRKAIYYYMAILTDPSCQGQKHVSEIVDHFVAFLDERDGMVAFDSRTEIATFLVDFLLERANLRTAVTTATLEAQHYFAMGREGHRDFA